MTGPALAGVLMVRRAEIAGIPTLFLLLALILAASSMSVSLASQTPCSSIAVIVYDDGGAWVYENITVANAPSNITVPLLAPPLTLYAEDQGGVPLPVTYTNTTATVTVYGPGTITIRYYTLALTSKTNYSWKLALTPLCTTIIVLPGDAVPIRVEPTPTPTLYKGQAALRFPAGEKILIEYYVIPGGATQAPTTTGQPSGTTSSPSPGASSHPSSTGTSAGTPRGNSAPWAIIAIIILLIIVFIGFSYLRSTRRVSGSDTPSQSSVEASSSRLDERDKKILEALQERPMTAVELQQATGIPKTPLYRRLKKLLEEGLIEYYEENGVRVYKLKARQ